jgi:DNA polymerase delta subunit 1
VPQVLTGQSLATFSLVDLCQSLLGQTLEVRRRVRGFCWSLAGRVMEVSFRATALHVLLPQVMPSHVVAALQQQCAAAAPPPAASSQPTPSPPAFSKKRPLEHDAAGPSSTSSSCVSEHHMPAVRAALRLARYSQTRCGAVLALMSRLASVPENFEMARATGLTLDQVCGGLLWHGAVGGVRPGLQPECCTALNPQP